MAIPSGNPLGTQSLFFVGSMAATGTVLTRIRAVKTAGNNISDIVPTEYVPSIKQRVQTDLRKVTLTSPFYGDSQAIYNLAGNIPMSATGLNSPCDYTEQYMVFIVDKASGSDKCYVLSNINSVGGRILGYSKENPTVVSITLEADDRDPSVNILFKGTLPDCITQLGVRSPL